MSIEADNNINSFFPNSEKNIGYTTPDNYFEEVEDDIFMKLSESNFTKQIDFTTPEGYFDKIEDEIFTKIKSSKKGKVITMSNRLWKIIPLAVAACLLLFFGVYFLDKEQTSNNTLLASDIEEWFDDSLEFSTNSELALILEGDLEFNDNEIVFQDDAIENYFDNISDIDLLNEIE